ncbi:dTMP kinase [Candidatus Dependentiae bacterium]|nr:dTMP kinase [Candidatus Dependentiae bacterium]
MDKGLFITFEGPEGCGKTTQISILAEYLKAHGIQYHISREPGGTDISNQIREILLNPKNKAMVSRTELLLYAADRAQHTEEVIKPQLQQGVVVISDRYFDSTTAYQGYGRGLDLDFVKQLNEIATGSLKPDLTILIDLEPEIGLRRALKTSKKNGYSEKGDRLEQEDLEFHKKVLEGYREIAKADTSRFLVINGEDTPENIKKIIIQRLKELITIND